MAAEESMPLLWDMCSEENREPTEEEKRVEDNLNYAEMLADQMRMARVKKRIEELEAKDPELRHDSAEYNTVSFPAGAICDWDLKAKEIGEEEIFSPSTTIGALSFRLGCKIGENEGWRPILRLYCHDNIASKTFRARVDWAVTVIYAGGSKRSTGLAACSPLSTEWEMPLLPLSFWRDGRLTIDAQLKLLGYWRNGFGGDLAPPTDPLLPDVTLRVRGRAFRANKRHLANYSEFFKVLFYSDFAEKSKKEIELGDVDARDFEELLRAISKERPTSGYFAASAGTMAGLLRVADFFGVDSVLWECERVLRQSRFIAPAAKLQLAEEFRLLALQGEILKGLQKSRDLFDCISSPEFGRLSEPLQIFLLRRYAKGDGPAPKDDVIIASATYLTSLRNKNGM